MDMYVLLPTSNLVSKTGALVPPASLVLRLHSSGLSSLDTRLLCAGFTEFIRRQKADFLQGIHLQRTHDLTKGEDNLPIKFSNQVVNLDTVK
jgi:hypothetical protein